MRHTLEGLEPEIDINRPASIVDLNGLQPVPGEVPIIFVVGSPRSGTTLVGNVLGANSQCASGDESLFLLSQWQNFDQLVLANNRRRSPYLSSYTTPQRALEHTATYVNSIYADLRDSQEARYAVDHTPVYGHVFEFIDLINPNANYLHVVRDASAVVKSLRGVKESGAAWGQSTDEARLTFRDHWVETSRAIGKKALGRYHEISYEDFCEQPEATMEPILSLLGLAWEDSMSAAMKIRYAQNGHLKPGGALHTPGRA